MSKIKAPKATEVFKDEEPAYRYKAYTGYNPGTATAEVFVDKMLVDKVFKTGQIQFKHRHAAVSHRLIIRGDLVYHTVEEAVEAFCKEMKAIAASTERKHVEALDLADQATDGRYRVFGK